MSFMLISEKVRQGIEYPDKLYELRNDYPLAPEKLAVSSDMFSNYCKRNADKFERKVGDVKNLISNLGNETNFVVHYRNLQLYSQSAKI